MLSVFLQWILNISHLWRLMFIYRYVKQAAYHEAVFFPSTHLSFLFGPISVCVCVCNKWRGYLFWGILNYHFFLRYFLLPLIQFEEIYWKYWSDHSAEIFVNIHYQMRKCNSDHWNHRNVNEVVPQDNPIKEHLSLNTTFTSTVTRSRLSKSLCTKENTRCCTVVQWWTRLHIIKVISFAVQKIPNSLACLPDFY